MRLPFSTVYGRAPSGTTQLVQALAGSPRYVEEVPWPYAAAWCVHKKLVLEQRGMLYLTVEGIHLAIALGVYREREHGKT